MLDEQIGLLTLLKDFDSICRKHNITYYLEGGSLLGAVRHKGFLPWDDDVDLCITRAEFKKLLAVIDQDLPANREIYCYERYPEYLRETVKFTNLDSTVLFPNHILDGLAAGQHIDLFILDPVPSNPKELEEYTALATVYSELMTPVYVMCEDIIHHQDLYNHYLHLMETEGREKVLNMLREKLYAYEDNDDCTTYYLRWGNKHRFFDKAMFGTPVEVEFEGGLYPAPQQYYRFLRAEFGDSWMMVPAAAQREVHGTYDCYNTPNKAFIADYTPFINFDEMRQAYAMRKKHNIHRLDLKHQVEVEEASVMRFLYEVTLEPMISSLSPEVQKLLRENRHQEVVDLMEPYWHAQLSAEPGKFDMPIAVHKDVLHAVAFSLVMVGRYWDAERLIAFHKKNPLIYTRRIKQLDRMITDIRGCLLACEEERYRDAAVLASPWVDRYPLQINLAVFSIEQSIRNGEELSPLLKKVKTLLKRYPNNDQLMYLAGRLHTAQGHTKKGMEWYIRCAAITHNGLIMMDLPAEAMQAAQDRK